MATSGSIDYNNTRNEIIKDALIEIGVLGAEETIHEADQALASRVLNRMVKAWNAQGIHLWTFNEATLFLQDEVAEYSLGSAAGDADWSDTVVDTTLSAAEASGQTVISCTTVTGMSTSDNVAVVLDDDTVTWSTISSIDTGASTITIADATSGAAAAGNRVYTYTTKANRPLKVHSIRRRTSTANDVPLIKMSREEYFDLPAKDSVGTPTQFYYDPQLTSGKLHLWPKPSDPEVRLKITYQADLEDFDAAANNPDFPQEWLECIVINLAARLARSFGKDQKLVASLKMDAEQSLDRVLSYDNEITSIQIMPNYDGR